MAYATRGRRNNLPNSGRPRFVQIRDKLRGCKLRGAKKLPALRYPPKGPSCTRVEDSSSRKKGSSCTKAEGSSSHNIGEPYECSSDDEAKCRAVYDRLSKLLASRGCTYTRPTADIGHFRIERKFITPMSLDDGDCHIEGMEGKEVSPAFLERAYRRYTQGNVLCDSPSSK